VPQARRRPWSRTLEFARNQRKEPSVEEGRLWTRLRNRQLADAKFRRQGRIGPYVVDFVCLEARLIVEIDGGAHRLPGRAEKDAIRQRWLEREGYRVLRFTDMQSHQNIDDVLKAIAAALAEAAPSSPALLPQGEKGE
jgi:very-short-patch-repair endonuclease